ncbi:hypothetical protein L1987_67233 [Smallanthus sonchifolius]|uniref:Uncharacterized protein n=1 Tax=Smallanthus sonchifolius TaxID=185202 RepID=A0ACB9BZQ0_9ASTR|nr:hypothetical protein L1987_67233 [Smallanthus sonchifolius]
MMSISPLGFNEFRVGKDMVKDAGETQSTWKSRKTRMDILKKEIATKEARLEEIASNINATDTNSALRNSTLKMKGSKLVKFSAKLNVDGVACIDENMIEAEREPSMEQPTSNFYGAMVNNTVYSGGNQSQEVNGNWQRKQERVLNTIFRNSLTQDQRFEAKRFVLDKLVPLDSSLSEWSTQLLEYFRHLCSIYEFGDGYLAASRDRMRSMGREETVYEEDMEDVD